MAAHWQRGGPPAHTQKRSLWEGQSQHQQESHCAQPTFTQRSAAVSQLYGQPATAVSTSGAAGAAGMGGAGGTAPDGRLRSVDELPACFRPVFSFKYFNAIQNECWPVIYDSTNNVVVAAPTGGGKTVLLELAILRLLSRNLSSSAGSTQFAHKPGHLKAVYLAPSRALVQEKVRDWSQRFTSLGVTCRELTGDTDHEGVEGLDSADIICATPEKFDAVTRGGMHFFADIGLVLIDEVHLLNENRGASLEGVVSRIKMISRVREMQGQPIGSVRYVAVSATVPNLQDLADWLGVPPAGIKCFGEEMRPVKLRTVVRGYHPAKSDFMFERRLSDYIYQVVAEHSSGKPALVFCSSRKGTSETATQLVKQAAKGGGGGSGGWRSSPSAYVRDAAQHQRLMQAAGGLKDAQLRECVQLGVGYHHAAMEPQDRAVVELLFVAQDLLVLCTTSTLAMGVNLPARLVVLKGTRRYVGSEAEDASGYQEYERSTCLQMVGRAGRPQFDTEGVAVIMTQTAHVRRYEMLTRGSELVESTLKDVLPEFLNAEITLRTIGDVSQAVEWLRCTYFYVRVRRNPSAYGVPRQPSPEALDRWLRDQLVLATVRELAQHGMVRLQGDGFGLEPLQPGQIMAERYIRMRTMISLCTAPPGSSTADLLTVVSKSAELANIKLRRSEKKVLNEVNHSASVRYPLMNPAKPGKVLERISTGPDKIFILMNEGLSDMPSDKLDYSLKQDAEQALSTGRRIAGAMVKYFEHEGRAAETFNALLLSKSLRQRLWTDSQQETRQLPGIGPQTAQRLAAAGITQLRQLAEVDPRRLETMAQRNYPFGNEVHAALGQCLPPTISLQCLPVAWLPGGLVELEVTVERTGTSQAASPARLLVGSLHDDALLLCRQLALEQFPSPLVLRARTRTAVKGSGKPVEIVASVVHERLVGCDTAVKTVVPPGVELQGQRCQPALRQAPVVSPQGTAREEAAVAAAADDESEGQSAGQVGSARQGVARRRGKQGLAASAADPEGSRRQGYISTALPGASPAPPSGMPGALQLMQRRMGQTGAPGTPSSKQQVGQGDAAAAPSSLRPPGPPQAAGLGSIAADAAAMGAAPLSRSAGTSLVPPGKLPQPPPAVATASPAGRSKWRNFVEDKPPSAQEAAGKQQTQTQMLSQRQQPQQWAAGAENGSWQQQRQPLLGRPPVKNLNPSPVPVPPAPPLGPLQPANRFTASSQTGDLFAQFALGSASAAAAAGSAAALRSPQAPQAGCIRQAGLLGMGSGGLAGQGVMEQVQEQAPAEASGKRRKLSSLCSALGSQPAGPAWADALLPPAATAPPKKVLQLPKLAWLSGRFSAIPAGSASTEPSALSTAAVPAVSGDGMTQPMALAAPPAALMQQKHQLGQSPLQHQQEKEKQKEESIDFAPMFNFFM